MTFAERLRGAVAARGPLCVGIDPHPALVRAWGLPDGPDGLRAFALACVDALGGEVAVLKPQSAFFEAHGAPGVAVLAEVLGAARAAGALVLLDAKRGDIGSTTAAYAAAHLADGAPLAADALTLSPYLGVGALDPALDTALATGRGAFLLARTSNPDGAALQTARLPDGRTVAQAVVDAAAARGPSIGVVVGATGEHGLHLDGLPGPVLAPGLGAQGAAPADLPRLFGAALPRVLPTTSRDVLRAGPGAGALRGAAGRVRDELAAVLAR